jgi:hypothetical protein
MLNVDNVNSVISWIIQYLINDRPTLLILLLLFTYLLKIPQYLLWRSLNIIEMIFLICHLNLVYLRFGVVISDLYKYKWR